jgi:hypothetical protein
MSISNHNRKKATGTINRNNARFQAIQVGRSTPSDPKPKNRKWWVEQMTPELRIKMGGSGRLRNKRTIVAPGANRNVESSHKTIAAQLTCVEYSRI